MRESAFFDEASIAVLEAEVRRIAARGCPLPIAATLNVPPLPSLASHSSHQLVAGTYSARSSRGLLRLYQLFPALADAKMIELILLRAIMALPEPTFLQCSSMILDSAATPSTQILANLEDMLLKSQFADFWKAAQAPELLPITSRVPGFAAAVRTFIASVVSRTYRRIATAELASVLGLRDVTEWVRAAGWATEGDAVILPANYENTPLPVKKPGEDGLNLNYYEVARVLAASSGTK